ncbi:uncharacterized protein [Drosophila bipectinata]|uniref:uncharacterized protein n=1 Tax=Drosophila bipectinata TaxID=42026 RepID=UPI0038B3BC06
MQAPVLGYFCNMCAEVHRYVIPLYGNESRRLELVDKMEKYLFVRVHEWVPLPKTICRRCVLVVLQVEQYYLHLTRLALELAGLAPPEEPIDLTVKPSQPALLGRPPFHGNHQ